MQKAKTLLNKKIYLADTQEWAIIVEEENGIPLKAQLKDGKIITLVRRFWIIATSLRKVIQIMYIVSKEHYRQYQQDIKNLETIKNNHNAN